jgi:hypothetical protein
MTNDYVASFRKDGYKWCADLYKDGTLFYKSWLYNFPTKKALIKEIDAMGVGYMETA